MCSGHGFAGVPRKIRLGRQWQNSYERVSHGVNRMKQETSDANVKRPSSQTVNYGLNLLLAKAMLTSAAVGF